LLFIKIIATLASLAIGLTTRHVRQFPPHTAPTWRCLDPSVMLLAGCGGGGGSRSPPAATVPAPGAGYSVGGSLSGLAAGSELKVALNGGLPLKITPYVPCG
jgi:hypothetical protein